MTHQMYLDPKLFSMIIIGIGRTIGSAKLERLPTRRLMWTPPFQGCQLILNLTIGLMMTIHALQRSQGDQGLLPEAKLDKHDCFFHDKKPSKSCVQRLRAFHTRKRHKARRLKRPVMDFGDLVTCDHVLIKDSMEPPGVGGYKDTLNWHGFGCD